MKHDRRLGQLSHSLSFAFVSIKEEGLIGIPLVGWKTSVVTLTPFSMGKIVIKLL